MLATVLSHVGLQTFQAVGGGTQPPALASLAGLINPFTVLAGFTDWLGSAPKVFIGGFGGGGGGRSGARRTWSEHFGPLYGVMLAVMLAAAIGGLLARYRKVGIA